MLLTAIFTLVKTNSCFCLLVEQMIERANTRLKNLGAFPLHFGLILWGWDS